MPRSFVTFLIPHAGHDYETTDGVRRVGRAHKAVTALTGKEGFDKVFAARPPLMKGNKPVLLAADAFDKQFVAAVIKRGPAITTYKVEAVTRDKDGIVYVQYTAEMGPAGTATFASPLIVSVPKEGAKKVVFIENGKTVGTAEVK